MGEKEKETRMREKKKKGRKINAREKREVNEGRQTVSLEMFMCVGYFV